MKKTVAIVLALALSLALFACGASQTMKDAAGTYKCDKYKYVGDTEWYNEAFDITLNEDGTGTRTTEDYSYDLTWKLDGETFTMTETFLGLTIDYTGALKDGVLDIFNGDLEDILTCEYVLTKN